MDLDKLIDETYPDDKILRMDGFDDCVVGIVNRKMSPPILCYDTEKVIEKMVKEGMTHEEAVEFFEFNQIGAWMGDNTPCFLETIEQLENR